ncbi:hypothetical protein Leryth_003665 [Lithospermum erythrorhizon]|nr:hypothetical protein Leryth_003665 [Lithospermum erythrorhizon]
MEGLCTMCPLRSRKHKMKRRAKGIIVDSIDDGETHEGIKTVEVENKTCEFSGPSDCCICILTWNMNGKKVAYEDIERLVGENRKFDLLVVGLQEAPRDNIMQMFNNTLVDTHSLLGKSIMRSVQLYVFGTKNSGLLIKDLKADKLALEGFGGCFLRRNKGAVAIRLNYKGIRLKFISSHLSAHARNVEKRNSQYRQIARSLFSKKLNPYSTPAQVTFWLGDLNYRLEGINTFPARDLIHKNNHQMLTSKDQLLQEAERGQIFGGYSEGTLTFKPTYKYDIGSSNYDTSHKACIFKQPNLFTLFRERTVHHLSS